MIWINQLRFAATTTPRRSTSSLGAALTFRDDCRQLSV